MELSEDYSEKKASEGKVSLRKFLQRRNLIIVLALVLLAEGVWAALTLSQAQISKQLPAVLNQETPKTPSAKVSTVSSAPQATLSLSAPKTTLKVGEKMTVTVNISSAKRTDGSDIVILYDPTQLSVVTQGSAKAPLQIGSVYSDFPLNSLDEKKGRIAASGITQAGSGVVPSGIFGTVVFQAKTAGAAKVSLDYTPGSTIDSNVIENKTAKDLLEKVENLELYITP